MSLCHKVITLSKYVHTYCMQELGHKGPCNPPRNTTIIFEHIETYTCNMCDPPEIVFVKDKIQHESDKHGRIYKQ